MSEPVSDGNPKEVTAEAVAQAIIKALIKDLPESAEGSVLNVTLTNAAGNPAGTHEVNIYTAEDIVDWLKGAGKDDGWIADVLEGLAEDA